MVLLIPLAVIFFCFAYLNLTDVVTILDKIIVTIIIITTLTLSFILYKRIKQNIKQQEKNKIIIEINNLQFKLSNVKDEKQKIFLKEKIEKLKKEKQNLI